MLFNRLAIILIVQLLIFNYNRVTCTECNNGEYAPDPYDCNAFLQCEYGMWIRRNCPRDLHFNAVNIICDFPWNANCVIDSTSSTTTSTPDPQDPSPTTTTARPTTSTTSLPITTTTTTQLPTFPPTTSTSWPTDTWPTETWPTEAWPTETWPTGTWPTGTWPTTTTEPPLWPTGTWPTAWPPTDVPTPPPHLSCLEVDGLFATHLPHPNCAMFYKCAHGIPHEMICPFSEHWAMFLDRCESPLEANCVDGAAPEQPNARPPNYW